MPHNLVWNKKHTKVKVWSTIVDAYITNFEKPEDLLKHPKHRNLVLSEVYGICPYCEQKLPQVSQKGSDANK